MITNVLIKSNYIYVTIYILRKKTLEKITKNYVKVLQNPPVTNKDTSEDISKVAKLP